MSNSMRVLVIDDELSIRVSLQGWLKKFGYDVDVAEDGSSGLEQIENRFYELIFLDLKMPGMDGIDVLKRIKNDSPDSIVVMITAHGSIESAVESMKIGAGDYLMKPFDPTHLSLMMEKFVQQQKILAENRLLRAQVRERSGLQDLIGSSDAMRKVFQLVQDVSQSEASVLIYGETGTGKEMVARAIHALSPRCYGPFVPINCGAFTESLLESELFGYEKGAFTGALYSRKGRIEMAGGGTLFLDEVGEIPSKMQVDLLRVLQEKKFHRIGSPHPFDVNFRLISATNKNLAKSIEQGAFRSDFYYRINVIALEVPPLRERKDDIPVLAGYFLDRYSRETGKRFSGISAEAMKLLVDYEWPGNVRELENVIERAVVLARRERIVPECLPFGPRERKRHSALSSLETVVRDHILEVLEHNEWNLSRASEVLGIHRSTLYQKMDKLHIKRGKGSEGR